MIGQTVGHYRILRQLGAGGMGLIYEAEDLNLERKVALKFLPRELTRDEEARRRFLNEARAASKLDHPNICTVYEIGEDERGRVFMAMACYEGETLASRIEKGPLPADEAIGIVRQVLYGLAKAHEAGIIHRDIKPANIILTTDGLAKIIDFGLAKLSGVAVTLNPAAMGTACYMAPEQIAGSDVVPATDLWAVGVVLYECLTGVRPFDSAYLQATMYSVLHQEPIPIEQRRADVQPWLRRIVHRLLRKSSNDRYRSAGELLADFASPRELDVDAIGAVPLEKPSGGHERLRTVFLLHGNRRLTLSEGANVIGRAEDADVTIPEAEVSRNHVRVVVSDRVTVEDLDSKNGTFVNGERIDGIVEVRDGDQVSLGPLLLTIKMSARIEETITTAR